jgi:hypothetical protein
MATAPLPADRSLEVVGGAEAAENRVIEASQSIINEISKTFQEVYRARLPIETRWMEDLRNFHGKYSERIETDLTKAERSTVFVNLTRQKTNAWEARLSDLLFPTDDKNWGVKPTPTPQLVEAAKNAMAQAKDQVEQANAAVAAGDPRAEIIAQQADAFAKTAVDSEAEIAESKKRASSMEQVIEDQLIESDYATRCRDIIADGCRLGTGILKGPVTSSRLRQQWRPDKLSWLLEQLPDPIPEGIRVDPWHFFPDMSANVISEAEFTFERSLPSKKDLRRFAVKFGFNRAAVKRLLEEGPGNTTSELDHLTSIRSLIGEGEAIKDRYVMLEYHGPISCHDIAILLRAMGNEEAAREIEDDKDPFEEHRVIIHFIGNEVLKIAPDYPLDSQETLYSVWNFEKGETSIFGYGVPYLARDPQKIINGATRMIMDNAALSVSGQILINKSAVEPEDGTWGLRPYKVWLMDSTMLQQSPIPPFQIVPIPNNQTQLGGIIEMGRAFLDEQVSMPQIAQGEQGSTSQTLGGMSMLFNSANVVFRRVVKSWDDELTKPTIRRFYHWNMQFNPDDSIKGDMQVDARGSSVLLVREIQSQNLMAVMTNWTVHPVIGPWVTPKVREGLAKTLQTMMIDPADMLVTQDEYNKAMADAAAAQAEGGGEDPELAGKMKLAEFERETKQLVLASERELKLLELGLRENLSLAQIEAALEGKRIDVGAKERMHAANIGVEEQRRRAAEAVGTPPQEAVGVGVG